MQGRPVPRWELDMLSTRGKRRSDNRARTCCLKASSAGVVTGLDPRRAAPVSGPARSRQAELRQLLLGALTTRVGLLLGHLAESGEVLGVCGVDLLDKGPHSRAECPWRAAQSRAGRTEVMLVQLPAGGK